MESQESELDTRARGRLGTVLRGKYRLDRVLGIGGMAVVYAATHRNQKQFAVKMLHPELSIRAGISARFLREGYVANSVKHPGAVAVLDDDVAEDGAAFLVMELLEGDAVDRLWESAGRRLPARIVLAIGHQLLDVLAAAHAKTIIHRDIKPANIFLARDGALKVLDFGIARLRDAAAEGAHATNTGMLLGTPAFMAPEQALAKSSEIDGQSDVWAVGATLFTLLAGHAVHEGESGPQVLVNAATTHARLLASVVPGVAPRVAEVIDRSLAFEKSARWASAVAMRDAIRDVYLETFGELISRTPLTALFPESDAALASTPMHDTPPPRGAQPSGGGRQSAVPAGAEAQRGMASSSLPGTLQAAGATPLAYGAPSTGPGRIAGGTTAQPVSNEPDPAHSVTAPRASKMRALVPLVAVVALLGVGGSVLAMKYSGRRGPNATSDAPPSASPLTAPAAQPMAAAPTAASAVAPIPLPAPAPSPTVTPPIAAPIGKHTPANDARPVPSTSPSAAPAKSAPPAPTPPAPAAAPTCHVVTYFDAEGNKRFKQECP